ncbi:thermonuclease family protein [Bradyrhizobium japonicum]|uniref:thermonuclease family protein n=1 Tax=Bradyrhizobium japonicum TaxID=375 RepID=UPI001B8A83FA|nr:thermonuclease family protein [Bradyrhizobium japonicum]MBR0974325.1 thermonuclease family protein [Bradyrhizobium japonicum]
MAKVILRILTPLLAIYLSLPALTSPARATGLVGQASIIDGDTLEIHGTRIRLWGIDAPESSQLCRGADSLPYRCGAKAATELAALVIDRPVSCNTMSIDRYGRTVALCTVSGLDLADWLVRHGLALDWRRYSQGHYAGAQDEAQRRSVGIWSGSFVEPWRFRDCIRLGGRTESCSDQ